MAAKANGGTWRCWRAELGRFGSASRRDGMLRAALVTAAMILVFYLLCWTTIGCEPGPGLLMTGGRTRAEIYPLSAC